MSDAIDFSVVIPTYNRPRELAVCLESVAQLDYPRERFEVLVVDDGSETPLEPVIAQHRADLRITLIRQARGGPARARNCGAAAARGRILAFTDDDCAPAPDWLSRLAASLDGTAVRVAGGRTVNALADNTYAAASQLLIDYLYAYFNRTPGSVWFLASCNIALSADVFRALGGFDPAYPRAAAEDRDFCDRLRTSGYRMTHAKDAVVYHRHSLTLSSFWRQHFFYGQGAHRFRRRHRERSGADIRVEPHGFYAGMLLYPFRRSDIRRPLRTAVLLAVSQVANAAGFLSAWARRSD